MTKIQTESKRARRSEAGYNLVEVLIAMAITGVVVISIMGLFSMSRKNVYSGRQMTQAISVGNRVQETIAAMDKRAITAAFGLGTGAGTSNTYRGITYANSIVRTTNTISTTTDPRGYLQKWKDEIVNNNKMSNGTVTMIFTPTADPTNNPAQVSTGTVLRVRTYVTWNEGPRSREVRFDTVKVQR